MATFLELLSTCSFIKRCWMSALNDLSTKLKILTMWIHEGYSNLCQGWHFTKNPPLIWDVFLAIVSSSFCGFLSHVLLGGSWLCWDPAAVCCWGHSDSRANSSYLSSWGLPWDLLQKEKRSLVMGFQDMGLTEVHANIGQIPRSVDRAAKKNRVDTFLRWVNP